jgi:hypothetical protein
MSTPYSERSSRVLNVDIMTENLCNPRRIKNRANISKNIVGYPL